MRRHSTAANPGVGPDDLDRDLVLEHSEGQSAAPARAQREVTDAPLAPVERRNA